jgi:DNA-binding CsgD family transcriptional regulator
LAFDMPLQERDEALAVVGGLLTESQAGQGRVLVLEGPAGIGKTRLLETIHARAEAAGLRTLRARAGELEQDFSYGIVRQLFEAQLAGPARAELLSGAAELVRSLFDVTGTGELPAADPEYGTLHGLYWLTVNCVEVGPLVVVVDDLQWCDSASLRYLAYLVRRLDGLGVLLVTAMRPRGRPEPGVIDEITDGPSATVLRLQPLSAEGVASLLSLRFGDGVDPQFSRTVHEWTAGNPLLLRELVAAAVMHRIETTPAGARQVRELSPEGVGRLVLRRIAPLGPRSLALAEATAVLGDDADIDRAATLAGLSRADAARAAGALQGIDVLAGAERLTFAHPLVRRVIYDDMDHARREALHASAADMLAAAEAAPARVAAHLLAVGPRGNPQAVTSLRAAAGDAMAQGAPDAAATYLARATGEPPPAEDRMSVMLELGLAQARARPADSVPQLMKVIEATDDDALLAQATIALAGVLQELGREHEWEPIALRVMNRIVDERAARQVEAQHVLLGTFNAEQYPAAKRRLDGIAVVEGTDDPASRLLLGLQASHLVRQGTQPRAALQRARASLAGDVLLRANTHAYGIPCSTLIHLDHFDEAKAALDAVLAHATRAGFLAIFKVASIARSWIALGRGDLSQAEAEAEALLASGTDRRRIVGLSLGSSELGQIALHRGDLEAAADHLDYADEVEQPAAWGWTISRGRRGQLRAAQGRLDEALDDLLTAGTRLAAFGCVNPALFPWRSEAALVLSRLGRHDDALELAHEEVELARVWGAPRSLGGALCTAGLVSGRAEGLALLREATTVLEPSPAALVRARAATELGAALRRANQRAEAREPLALGLELAERAGATALVERAREELIATGARPRRAARTGVASLTASERRIAHLAAAGQTNRDIAQALFVTPKTVEVHLSHTYQKLGLRSRSQLPEALRAHEQELTR